MRNHLTPEIRAGIFAGESGGDYDALFGFSNRSGPFSDVRVSDMTLDQAIAFSDPRSPYAQWVKNKIGRVATPMGAYQVVGTTLRGAVDALGLPGDTKFDQATQDLIGDWIYRTQGTGAWEGYKGPRTPSQAASAGAQPPEADRPVADYLARLDEATRPGQAPQQPQMDPMAQRMNALAQIMPRQQQAPAQNFLMSGAPQQTRFEV